MDFITNLMGTAEGDAGQSLPSDFWVLTIQIMVALVFVYIGFRVIKGSEKSFPLGVVAKAKYTVAYFQTQIFAIKQLINNVFRSQEWKYEKPWYLMVGSEKSEEAFLTDCLASRLMTEKLGPETTLEFTAGRVIILNNGLVIGLKHDGEREDEQDDIDSEEEQNKDESPGRTVSSSLKLCQFYLSLVKEVIQARSQRALDGIVLVVSAKELLADGKKESDRFSIILADRVRSIQQLVEFSLPVYLIVSEAQELECFDSFWNAQPAELDRQQVFGWSSPHTADILFREQHLDAALAGLESRLNTIQLQTELTSDHQHDIDGFLGFPKKLSACYRPLRRLVLQIFNTNAIGRYLQFRGVYFCGRLTSKDDLEKTDKLGKTVTFIDRLFDEVIFGSGMQAEPTRKRILSRNIYVFRFQMLMIATTVLMFGNLYFSNQHLDNQIASITEVVKNVHAWQSESLASCETVNSSSEVYSLLANMANLDGRPVHWNLPLSWLETVSSLTDKSLVNNGMNKIVLPNIECHLQAQAKKLSQIPMSIDNVDVAITHGEMGKLQLPPNDLGFAAVSADVGELESYVADVIEFEKNLEDFLFIAPKREGDNSEAQPMSVLIRLLEAVYREEAPTALRRKDGQHKTSLVRQHYPLQWMELYAISGMSPGGSDYCLNNSDLKKYDSRQPISVALIANNVCLLAERIYNDIVSGSSIVETGTKSLSETLNNVIADDPAAAFEMVKQWRALASQFEVQNGVEFNTPCQRARLHVERFSYTLAEVYNADEIKLFSPAMNLFSAKGDCESQAKANIASVEQALADIGRDGSGTITLDIATFLTTAEQKRYFSQPALAPVARTLECKNDLTSWDIASLSQAEAYIREYQTLVDENNWQSVAVGDSPLKRLALNQLNFALNQVLYAAQKTDAPPEFELDVLSAVSVRESKLAAKGVNFNRAVNHIIPIAKDLSSLELEALGVALTKCSRNYAKDIVNNVQGFSTPLGLYRELPQASQTLPLNSDFSFTLYNKADVEDYLDSEQKRTRIILSYIESALVLLGETQHIEGYDWQTERPTIAFWRNTLTDFSSYQRELANTQLGELHALYQRLAADDNLCENIDSLPIGGFGYDLFAKRRSQLVVSLSQLCQTQLIEAVGQNYLFIFNEFNQRFENRYPFTLNRQATEQASASEFREFLMANGGAIENLLGQTVLLGKKDKRWQDIHDFLSQIAELKRVFASSLTHEPQARPLYLSAQFDVPKDTNLVSSQATRWELATPRYSITNTDLSDNELPPQLIWRFGDELAISIDWSKDSPYVVVNNSDIKGSTQQHSKRYSQKFSGDWSLLRLFDRYGTDASDGSLLVNVPLQIAPELQGGTAYQNLGSHGIGAPLYLTVQPFAQNDQGVLEPIELPKRFPIFAPPLPGDFYVYH